MFSLPFSPSLIAVLVFCAFTYSMLSKKRLRSPLPPGPPKTLPFLGNIFHFPKSKPWETFTKWGNKYNSKILHVGGMGLNIIVLNSVDAVVDLFDKRSSIYSSRPEFPIMKKMDGDFLFVTMAYGDPWRARRKLFQRHFHPARPEAHESGALKATRELFLPQLLKTPNSWPEICRHTISAYILTIAYGIKTQPANDPFISLSGEAVQLLNETYLSPLSFLMFLAPPLQYLPEWCFGPKVRRHFQEAKRLSYKFRTAPFDEVEQTMTNQMTTEASFTSMCLEELPESGQNYRQEKREEIKDTAAMFYAGGVDTTLAGIYNFILAMVLHPDKQAKAQEELDKVIGSEARLPEYADEQNLPYLRALVKEVMRWRPWFPQGMPHLNVQEDEYNGYYIPKNSIIIANAWGMMRDERDYPDPDLFKPERFLDSQGNFNSEIRDPESILFGFGRRACPGMHIAQSTLFIIAAHMLLAFNVKPAVDKDGAIKEPSQDWPEQVICPPLPFECQFAPRSESAAQLVHAHERV